MKRIEKIKQLIESSYADKLFSANNISDVLNIQRCDASSDLNKLYKQGFLKKEGKHPVLYKMAHSSETKETNIRDNDRYISTLDYLIETSPSIKKILQLAKTAISYPPHGLNTLITGSTGVGKSYLAEIMWEYACKSGLFPTKDKTPFITFNCAEYADNPQLLLSRLFGYVKGAFTGAEKDTNGLMQEANGGIIFLDEIHRLPPAGQEMLFSIIDHGTFRKMGDNVQKKISVMIICATTLDPNNALLDTYVRRFPVLIKIPNLSERTPKEKLQLITDFFTNESISINMPIFVMGGCLKTLMSYEANKGNIGEIKNMINLACAKSYLRFLMESNKNGNNDDSYLKIMPYDFSTYMGEEIYNNKLSNDFTNLQLFQDGLMIYPFRSGKDLAASIDEKYNFDLYSFVQQKLENYKKLSIPTIDVTSKITADLDAYYKNIILRFKDKENENTKMLYGIIAPLYFDVASYILKKAEVEFNCKYSDSVYMAFSLHLQEFHSRIDDGKIVYNSELNKLKGGLAKEIDFLCSIRKEISSKLNSPIPDDELWFWANFIKNSEIEDIKRNGIDIIVVCHGDNIASQYAKLVNTMMHSECVCGINASLDSNFEDVFNQICQAILSRDSKEGVLVMADMGSLVTMEKHLIEKTKRYCRVMPIVATPVLLDVAKKTTLLNIPLDVLFDETYSAYINYINEMYDKIKNSYQTSSEDIVNSSADKFIISICSSGYGSAAVVKDILKEKLSSIENLEIINVGITEDIAHLVKTFGTKIKLIIGGLNPSIPNVKFVSIEKAFTDNGIEEIKSIINDENININENDTYISITNLLPLISKKFSTLAPHTDSDALYEVCEQFIACIPKIVGYNKSRDFYVSFLLHFIGMVERIKSGELWNIPSFGNRIISSKHNEYVELKKLLLDLCKSLEILNISDAELSYFLIMF